MLTVFFFSRTSPRRTCPALRIRSWPPPLISDELSPEPLPPVNATLSGVLK